MNFLNYVDSAYEESRGSLSIQENNNDYRLYFDLSPTYSSGIKFSCMKRDKAHIIISKNSVINYLSDADIVYNLSTKTIVNRDIFALTIDLLRSLYKGNAVPFSFTLDGHEYTGFGLPYFTDPIKDVMLHLHSDIEISVNDFIFVLNMIFEKDRLTDKDFGGDHLKHTLCKYIALTKHYRQNDSKAKLFLKSIGYKATFPIRKSLEMNEVGFRRRIFKECKLAVFEKSGLL